MEVRLVLSAIEPNSALTLLALGTGTVAALAAIFKIGPDRTNVQVGYQAQIVEDLHEDRKRLLETIDEQRQLIDEQRDEIRANRVEIKDLNQRVLNLELSKDEPPPHLA